MKSSYLKPLLGFGLAVFVALSGSAQAKKKITFAKGKSSAAVSGSIKGYAYVDHQIEVKQGQTLSVSLKTNKASNYFNVLPPGSDDVAIYNSSINGNKYSGEIGETGLYSIRVYLERSDARRNVTATYTLNVVVTGSTTAPKAGDAKVAGTQYNATGRVKAMRGAKGWAQESADFGVIRYANGEADVHVTIPGSPTRKLHFAKGEWACKECSTITYDRSGVDGWQVKVNDAESYIIPDAVVTGG